MSVGRRVLAAGLAGFVALAGAGRTATNKPVLHGKHWLAITGKPLAATAGAMTFQKGGNAVDAACAMLAATTTMFDTLSWGGETQALIFNPQTGKVVAVNALGVAPTGATPAFFRGPRHGLSARVRTARRGHARNSGRPHAHARGIREALARGGPRPGARDGGGLPDRRPARRRDRAREGADRGVALLRRNSSSPTPARRARLRGRARSSASRTSTRPCRSCVEAEAAALAAGQQPPATRSSRPMTASISGDIAAEFVRGAREQGGLITLEDLARWKPRFEEPVRTTYRGIDVYKLDVWTQGPAMLQALNLLEPMDLRAMGYNSARYIHALYQVMNLAFADRDFYYGDPDLPPAEPRRGLLSKEYAAARAKGIDWTRNDAAREARRSVSVPGRRRTRTSTTSRSGRATRRSSPDGRPIARSAPGRARSTRVSRRHDLDRGGRRGGLGRLGHAVGRLEPGLHRGPDGDRHEPADAELRPRPGREPVQRARARQAAARDPDPETRAQGRKALSGLRGAGRRHAGSEPAAVLPERRRVRHERAGGGRGAEHRELPDAELVRRARVAARTARRSTMRSRPGCATSSRAWATRSGPRRRPPGRSTPSSSTASTERCGAARATTARTTGSAGERGERPRALRAPDYFFGAGQAGGQGSAGPSRRTKNSPEAGPLVSRAKSSVRPLGEKTAPISVPLTLTSGRQLDLGRPAVRGPLRLVEAAVGHDDQARAVGRGKRLELVAGGVDRRARGSRRPSGRRFPGGPARCRCLRGLRVASSRSRASRPGPAVETTRPRSS